LKARMCPKKDDLYYENLHRSEEEIAKGRKRGTISYIVLIIMFSPLMVLIQGLADLDSLAEDSGLVKDITDLSPPFTAMIQGFLPVIIFAAFFAFLPKLLWMIVDMSFPKSKTDQESRVLPMYTDCLIGMGLLVSVFAAVFSDVGSLTSVSDITNTAAEEMPSQSIFWMGYILNAAFFGVALELSGIVRITVASIMGYEQPEIEYYLAYPTVLMMFCIILTYSVIAPITLLWGVLYFGFSYCVFKYMLLYVYKPTRSCYTLKFFPGIFSRFHFGIFISQLILFGLFLSYSAVGQAILTFLTMILTIASARSATRGFDYYLFPDDRSGISEVSSLLMDPENATEKLWNKTVETAQEYLSNDEEVQQTRWIEDERYIPPSILAFYQLRTLQKNDPVVVTGLNNSEFNGIKGKVISINGEQYRVRFLTQDRHSNFPRENLRYTPASRMNPAEQLQFLKTGN